MGLDGETGVESGECPSDGAGGGARTGGPGQGGQALDLEVVGSEGNMTHLVNNMVRAKSAVPLSHTHAHHICLPASSHRYVQIRGGGETSTGKG